MVINILRVDSPALGLGQKAKIQPFSEYGRVVYQIKGNVECSNTQAHILYLHTASTPEMGQKVITFFFLSSHVAYWFCFIKLMEMEYRAPCKHMIYVLSLYTPSTTEIWSKGQNIFFLEVVWLNIKLKVIEHKAPC